MTLGEAGVFWEGFSEGLESPIDVRLRNLTVRPPAGGAIEIPEARIALAVLPLLEGRFEPRSIVLDHPRLDVPPSAGGVLPSVAPVDPRSLRAFLARTPDLRAVSELRIQDGTIAAGQTWSADGVEVDLARSSESGLTATASATIQLAGAQAKNQWRGGAARRFRQRIPRLRFHGA